MLTAGDRFVSILDGLTRSAAEFAGQPFDTRSRRFVQAPSAIEKHVRVGRSLSLLPKEREASEIFTRFRHSWDGE